MKNLKTQISLDDFMEQLRFMEKLETLKKHGKITNEQKLAGCPIEKLDEFIKLTTDSKDFSKLERFVRINGKPVEKTFADINNKKLSEKNCHYANGCVLEKVGKLYKFTTYTIDQGICVLNHQSIHTDKSFGMIQFKINYFDNGISTHTDYGDGEDYVNQILDEYIEMFDCKSFWDKSE